MVHLQGLNPYSNGTTSLTRGVSYLKAVKRCLNPYSNGTTSLTILSKEISYVTEKVLILILMELPL